MGMVRRVVENYPKPVILYVDEANAPLVVHSPLDDLFTFNTQTDELVLFSADPHTFINALIEMWMYVVGFDTRMSADHYWEVEFAIGAWRVVRDNIKRRLGIPTESDMVAIVGLPPDPDETTPEDPYPFQTMVSSLNDVSFVQLIRLAGHNHVRVHFPPKTDPKVLEAYFNIKRVMRMVGKNLDIGDTQDFNRKLDLKIRYLRRRYQPENLPTLEGWGAEDESASGDAKQSPEEPGQSGLLLGPPKDEPPFGSLPPQAQTPDEQLAEGPFGAFIETLFDD